MPADPEPAIRPATAADVPALAEVGAATFVETFAHLYAPEDLAAFLEETHSPAAWTRRLAEPGVVAWLAELPGAGAVAYATAGPCKLPVPVREPRAGEMRQLYVRGKFQKLRLGSRLLAVALDWLEAAGYAPLYVGVWSENYGAQRLYGRYGFTKVGEYEFPVGRQRDREFILKQAAPR
jgi:ribosomal protein S18 acetylase RimI-like enzyme